MLRKHWLRDLIIAITLSALIATCNWYFLSIPIEHFYFIFLVPTLFLVISIEDFTSKKKFKESLWGIVTGIDATILLESFIVGIQTTIADTVFFVLVIISFMGLTILTGIASKLGIK